MDQAVESAMSETAAAAVKGAESMKTVVSDASDRAAANLDRAAAQGADAAKAGADRMSEEAQSVADRTAAVMEGAAEQGRALSQDLQAVTEEWAACARMATERALDRMNVLSQARNPADLIGAHRDLVWGGVEDLLTAQQRIAQAAMTLMTNSVQRMAGAQLRLAA